jgi:HEAT repeat protein
LERWVRHLSLNDQESILDDVLDQLSEPNDVRDVVDFIARYGEGDVFELFERVGDATGDTRDVYIDALGRSGRSEAVEVAGTLARSRDSETRMAALEIAAAVGGDAGRSLLEELLGDSQSEIAHAAALRLAPMGVPAAYAYLLELAQSGDMAQRIEALGAIRDGQPALLSFESLNGMLETAEDADLRRVIVEAMGATGSDAAYDMFVEALAGDVYALRVDAIAGLGYTRRDSAAPLLGEVLLGGGSADLRGLAADALGHLHSEAAAAALIEALGRERGGDVMVRTLQALASSSSEEALWPVAFLLTNDEEAVVRAALETLAQLGARSIAAQVENVAVSHRNPGVRWTATLVLFSLDPEVGQIRLMQALDRPPDNFMGDIDMLPEGPRLEAYARLMRHTNEEIRAMTSSRVLRLGVDGLDIFRGLLELTVPADTRLLAVSVLTANRDPRDIEVFREFADSSSRTMRDQALEALIELGDPSSDELLRDLLDSTDLQRRTMAVYGLWKIGGP